MCGEENRLNVKREKGTMKEAECFMNAIDARRNVTCQATEFSGQATVSNNMQRKALVVTGQTGAVVYDSLCNRTGKSKI